jgi:hypothetical protein
VEGGELQVGNRNLFMCEVWKVEVEDLIADYRVVL